MGFGGFFMHTRIGLGTEYLGTEFLEVVKACALSAEQEGMCACLYDEDRWPSGFAGGLVTQNKRFRVRYLVFTPRKLTEDGTFDKDGKLLSGRKLLARYKVFAPFGILKKYSRSNNSENKICNRYAYLQVKEESGWFNDNTYVDSLNKEALDCFAETTYGAYEKAVGGMFGSTVPAVFTDEPQLEICPPKKFSFSRSASKKPWTDDFEETFFAAYGFSILDRLPELFLESDKGVSEARYRYYDHLSDRFAQAFCYNLGKKCEKLNLKLTGHLMDEPLLSSQTMSVGDAMRQYDGFEIPGIDVLCDRYEFTTAKQAQSAVRQFGKPDMVSELYAVTRWDTDFGNYKTHGDWQAALGVTVRVHNLAFMSLAGEGKRDYPASIFYQSSWYKKYPLVEDHFARLNAALSSGQPVTDIAVVHPLESFWLDFGPLDKTSRAQKNDDERFLNLTEWLLRGGLDFDFINEATLPSLCTGGNNPLEVGKMRYKTVLVPDCKTLRKTTLDILSDFVQAGGKVIFAGKIPHYCDAKPDKRAETLALRCTRVPFEKSAILASLEEFRQYGVYKDGVHTDNTVCQLKKDDGGLWLFVARANHARRIDNTKIIRENIIVKVKGDWQNVRLFNTLDGSVCRVKFAVENGETDVELVSYNHDSFLLRFDNTDDGTEYLKPEPNYSEETCIADNAPFSLSEPNALLLDKARFSLDGGKLSVTPSTIIEADRIIRKKLNFPKRGKDNRQLWAQKKTLSAHTVTLQFTINSKIDYSAPKLAIEEPQNAIITWNGQTVNNASDGTFADCAIKTVQLPPIKKGKNYLTIKLPFGKNSDLENCYFLGDFGVTAKGAKLTVTELPKTLKFADVTKQGLPFYGGKITYHTSFVGNGKNVKISMPPFDTALIEVTSCGVEKNIAYSPYTAELPSLNGVTPLTVGIFMSRQNAFGAPHFVNIKNKESLMTPSIYRAPRLSTRNAYILCSYGIFGTPKIKLQK